MFELFLSRTNFLSQRKRGTFSLCACVLLPVSAAPRQIPLRSMDDPPVSLFNNNNARYSVCACCPFYGERKKNSQSTPPKTEASFFRSVNCSGGVGSVWGVKFGYDLIRRSSSALDFDTLNFTVQFSACFVCPLKIGEFVFYISVMRRYEASLTSSRIEFFERI